jgi:hypothetical protein
MNIRQTICGVAAMSALGCESNNKSVTAPVKQPPISYNFAVQVPDTIVAGDSARVTAQVSDLKNGKLDSLVLQFGTSRHQLANNIPFSFLPDSSRDARIDAYLSQGTSKLATNSSKPITVMWPAMKTFADTLNEGAIEWFEIDSLLSYCKSPRQIHVTSTNLNFVPVVLRGTIVHQGKDDDVFGQFEERILVQCANGIAQATGTVNILRKTDVRFGMYDILNGKQVQIFSYRINDQVVQSSRQSDGSFMAKYQLNVDNAVFTVEANPPANYFKAVSNDLGFGRRFLTDPRFPVDTARVMKDGNDLDTGGRNGYVIPTDHSSFNLSTLPVYLDIYNPMEGVHMPRTGLHKVYVCTGGSSCPTMTPEEEAFAMSLALQVDSMAERTGKLGLYTVTIEKGTTPRTTQIFDGQQKTVVSDFVIMKGTPGHADVYGKYGDISASLITVDPSQAALSKRHAFAPWMGVTLNPTRFNGQGLYTGPQGVTWWDGSSDIPLPFDKAAHTINAYFGQEAADMAILSRGTHPLFTLRQLGSSH